MEDWTDIHINTRIREKGTYVDMVTRRPIDKDEFRTKKSGVGVRKPPDDEGELMDWPPIYRREG